MHVALNRKRSRLDLELDDEAPYYRNDEAVDAPQSELKKTKTQSELDEVEIMPSADAWAIDIDSILSSPTVASSSAGARPHDNAERYKRGASITVLCVQGNLHLHYDLLCSILPELYTLSPTLQALVLCREPSTHVCSTTAAISLPLIQGVGTGYNHFVRLGLLHPLGGGDFPLDALVVVDAKGKRRLVLPFGWGGGRHAGTPAGRGVQNTLMELLKNCIRVLALEG